MIKKRIIAVTLVMALTLAMLPTAHAVNPLEYVRTTFWDYVHDSVYGFGEGVRTDLDTLWNSTVGAFLDGFNGNPEEAYDGYVAFVYDAIGTPIIGKDSYIIPLDPMGAITDDAMSRSSYTPKMYPSYSYVTTTLGTYFGYSQSVLKNLYEMTYTMPFDGYWRVVGDWYTTPDAQLTLGLYHFNRPWSNACYAGSEIRVIAGNVDTHGSNGEFRTLFFRAALEIRPAVFNPDGFTVPIGGSGSRLTNTGINIIGGDNTVYENVNFVDETNQTFYNPTTNTTTNFTDWQYDYSTREYTLTTSDNKQITIRYGDDSVVYKEGDTIVYNYYYALPDTPAPTPTPTEPTPTPPAPTAHVHSWVKSNDASFGGSCMTGAVDEYFCADANCTETHSITYAAAGHVWIEKQVVLTTYDENGDILQNGYVIFQCKACGEEYRSDNGQAPPTGGGNGHAGSRNIFEIMFGLLADFFGFFVNLLLDFIPNSLRDFFTSITDTSSDVFGIFETTHGGGQSNGSGAGRP